MSKYAGFQSVQLVKPKRSDFDLSHQKRLTTRMGRLTPCLITEAVPSDTFNGSSEVLLRLAPLLAPIYDQIQLYVHFFFVPNRLLWEDWETFITGGREGAQIQPELAPVPPYVDIGEFLGAYPTIFDESSLADYLGVPIFSQLPGYGAAAYEDKYLDIMPFLAYQLCYMEYYRDRNFVADDLIEFPFPSGEYDFGTVGTVAFQLRTRSYEHEYFTSSLPFVQRGAEVLMPLAGTGSVTYLDQSLVKDNLGDPMTNRTLEATTGGLYGDNGTNTVPGRIENIDEVELDASSVSINDWRSAYALQVWLERNAIAGSRYTESTQAHFGVRPQDSRLQRPEYIGGGRINVQISEVVSTAYSSDGEATVPLANMAGHGVTYGNTNKFRYFCPEHGFIIGIMSIMNPPSYHQGLPRMFRRRTFLDYPWPTFAKLGEQEVAKAELFASANNLTEDENGALPLFGYQSRYADWKYICNTNHGEFHSSLLFWTLTRDFSSSPTLGNTFVQFDDATQNRIFAVSEGDNFWVYCHNRVHVRRPLPYFGTPNTLGFV